MKYIDSFKLAGEDEEAGFVLSYPRKLEMTCYTDNVYPFKIFPPKMLEHINFEQITIFYGGNGSGKSTLLNIIAEKLSLLRSAPFNKTPFYEDYLSFCRYKMHLGEKNAPRGSRIIASDDVFDYLLDIRAINEGIDRRREEIFAEYDKYNDPTAPKFRLGSLDDYDELKRRNEARGKSKSAYTGRRVARDYNGKSNGESAYKYFTEKIEADALYLLDEPENSLSATLVTELAEFIESSARFYNCQFIISTHSPFILSLRGAKIYNLDSSPVKISDWTELENVRAYYDFFIEHKDEFK